MLFKKMFLKHRRNVGAKHASQEISRLIISYQNNQVSKADYEEMINQLGNIFDEEDKRVSNMRKNAITKRIQTLTDEALKFIYRIKNTSKDKINPIKASQTLQNLIASYPIYEV